MKQNLTPVVFVPGVFGSMSDVIIPGTGDWSFGVAKVAYGPFIVMLELMGYELNKSLFIAFYDWRKSCILSAKNYLYQKIKEAKSKTGSEKVNIICHSMGGLVTRSYVQSNYYKNDVDKMIFMATPNMGSVSNFCYWTGGEIPKASGKYSFVNMYMKAYLEILKLLHAKNPIKGIHEEFPGLSDLLPSKQYGDFLYTRSITDIKSFIPQKQMYTHNKFLNELNKKSYLIQERNIDVTIVAGIGEPTMSFLQVSPTCSDTKWIDGEVVNCTDFLNGDGCTTLRSVFFLDGDKYAVEGAHIEMLYKSEPIIRRKLV